VGSGKLEGSYFAIDSPSLINLNINAFLLYLSLNSPVLIFQLISHYCW
ncbi:MAG: hypothetical protein ACI9ES_003166, partial [Oceanospirillaceae bacterium]